jgi:hypothetical protein
MAEGTCLDSDVMNIALASALISTLATLVPLIVVPMTG